MGPELGRIPHPRWQTAGPFVDAEAISQAGLSAASTSTSKSTAIQTLAQNSYELRTAQLASGKTMVTRWNPCQTAITYRVNLSGVRQARRAALLKEIKTSFGKLAAADGITYRYKGSTDFIPQTGNLTQEPAEIVVAAVSRNQTDLGLAENSLGYGGVLWSSWSGSTGEGVAAVRGYVILSPSGFATLKPGFGRGKTQGNVILHELGHATGLNHVDSISELMNPVLLDSAPNGYAAGDLAGLRKLGAAAGCLQIPSSVTIADLN